MFALLKLLLGFASDWLSKSYERRQKRADAEMEITLATAKSRAAIEEAKATADINWDTAMADATKTSWKDEWFTVVLTVPLILAFLGFDGTIKRGFTALDSAPDWYFYALMAAIAASFGLREIVTKFARR